LIESVLLQQQDMDVHPEIWSYRERYMETGRMPGPPHQGLGRGFKVGKEEIAGLVTALKLYVQRDHAADRARWDRIVGAVLQGVQGLPHVRGVYVCPAAHPMPRAHIELDEAALGFSAFDAIAALLAGTPRVAVDEGRARGGALVVTPISVREQDVDGLVGRLRVVLGRGS
jgi:L-seryl-tRNA(Ser) seleniumtransferase